MLKSRFPVIIAELGPRMNAVAREGAELIAQRAKQRVPVGAPEVHLRDAIHVEDEKRGSYLVVAGDTDAWYGHLVEFGTTHSAPRPFLLPSFEESTDEIAALAQVAVSKL